MGDVAIISDIHANLEALDAVLADIDARPEIDAIYCLGDLVGYGPDPARVIDRVRKRTDFILMGNHDQAVTTQPLGFSQMAAAAVRWHRQELEPGLLAGPGTRARWAFIQALPQQRRVHLDLFVHASPRDRLTEYILPGEITRNPGKIDEILALVDSHCFVGHTHMPGVFLAGPRFLSPAEMDHEYVFKPGEKAVINVSSVGQPRDRDPRACYATLTEAGVTWHRVEYDVEITVAKIKSIPQLDDRCGLRLLEGK